MSYVFRKAGFMLMRHKAIYLLLIVEMAVGMSLYVYSSNLSYSIQKKEDGWRSLETDYLLRISETGEETTLTNLPIDLKDYEYIQMLAGDDAFFFIDIPDIIIEKDHIVEYDLLFVDFQKYGLNPKYVYMGKYIKNQIRNDGARLGIGQILLEQTRIVLNTEMDQQKYFEIKDLSAQLDGETLKFEKRDEGIAFTKAILFPITEMESLLDRTPFHMGGFQLGIKSEHIANVEYVLDGIIQHLSERHGDYYGYKFYSPTAELQNDTYQTKLDINAINKIGVLMLATLLVASISIFRMLLGKRERELGICQACGAGIPVIMMEIAVEVFVVCLGGTALGCVGGFVLTYNFTSFLTGIVKMTGHWQTVGISAIVCMMITVIVSTATIQKFYFKRTMELIQDKC
ncbi:FtsX-like permease family protein [Faecalicatena contorta]|uniref:FtsX-like permease family protein n=1 Tax=Faecalicatena contorta TaxID=39482 RepID=A0A315ZWX7_9FIRM|nr:FtsX-like permease family protein [Faecalicatena contorta]PWJ49773.1 FtsX-like permease family protein [Faecalicatena contorta]SUQ14491.1 FtsX-like permease family protein [Faecalicatena contorta]